MSVKLSAYVWDGCAAAGLKGVKLLIMARLADFSNDDGISYPGVDTIARQTGAGRSTVITAITELQSDGWLVRKERRKGNRNQSNLYYLNVKKLRTAASAFYADGSESEHSESERSKSECTESERSENKKNSDFDGSESGGDPSVNSKQDPSDNKTLSQAAAQPDDSSDESFLALHPEAVVFNAKKRKWGSEDDLTAAEYIWRKIIQMYERAAECDGEIARPKEPDMTLWANEVRLMCTVDGHTHKQICELFVRANRDPFWCKNILSPSKLREKWDDLTIRLSCNAIAGAASEPHWNSPEAWENTL
ncbi:UNVERIFIED_ORG: biotin operon repressor [Rahnella aquatilis]|uniref:helix-turn-helix domain-containing protein n=1 Tax=Rahnella sp. 2050 TaxID=3156425 RepID=UPI001B51ED91|nr:biotin operon repressor [Rahnella aquatilis]